MNTLLNILYIVLLVGQIENFFKILYIGFLKKKSPIEREYLESEHLLTRLAAQQHMGKEQNEIALRILGLFLFYGAIWGVIDILNYLGKNKEDINLSVDKQENNNKRKTKREYNKRESKGKKRKNKTE
jgi:hypothetical protein